MKTPMPPLMSKETDMTKSYFIPRKGLLVPNPENGYKPLPPEGAEVTQDRYWRRRLAEGDVQLAKVPAAAPKAKKSEKV
jgi:hypothetical protein